MTTLVMFGLMFLAVHRITHFITRDNFPLIKWFREMVLRKTGVDSPWSYLVKCMWCTSVYVSAGVVTFVWLVPGAPAGLSWPFAVLTWLGLSSMTGYSGQLDTIFHNLGAKLELEKRALEREEEAGRRLAKAVVTQGSRSVANSERASVS